MRRRVAYALFAIALLTLLGVIVSIFIQPNLSVNQNQGLLLFLAILLGVTSLLAGFKDVIELFKPPEKPTPANPSPPAGTTITGPVHLTQNVVVNVNYIVQSTTLEALNLAGIAPIEVLQRSTTVPRLAPPLPPGFIPRTAEVEAIKRILFQEGRTVALVGLGGMAGVGKTTLALAIAHDPQVEQTFPDGVLWAPVERVRDFREIITHWISALSPSTQTQQSSYISLMNVFRLMVQNRRLLLVLDGIDKVNASQVQDIIESVGSQSKVLVTSRVVNLPGVQTLISLDVLPEHEAVSVLEKSFGKELTDDERTVAKELAFLLGYLPLALAITGGFLRSSGLSFGEYRDRLRSELGAVKSLDLDEVRAVSTRSIQVSLEYVYKRLSTQEQARFRALSVLPPAEPFDENAVSAIWRVEPAEVPSSLSLFLNFGLLTSADGLYRLHPMVYSYIKELFDRADQTEREEVQQAYDAYVKQRT